MIYENAASNRAAYVPDLPGCIGVGETKADCERNIAEGIEAYSRYLIEEGEPVPAPVSTVGYVKVAGEP